MLKLERIFYSNHKIGVHKNKYLNAHNVTNSLSDSISTLFTHIVLKEGVTCLHAGHLNFPREEKASITLPYLQYSLRLSWGHAKPRKKGICKNSDRATDIDMSKIMKRRRAATLLSLEIKKELDILSNYCFTWLSRPL